MGDAEAWVCRLKQWKVNLIADLQKDSVPAPGQYKRRWLLYVPAHRSLLSAPEDAPDISCTLCRKCAAQLARLSNHLQPSPEPLMPLLCRANGLWGGPEPRELAVLTYAERRVIQLARFYISLKRVHPCGAPYNPTLHRDQPL